MFSRKFRFLGLISRGGNARFAPAADAHDYCLMSSHPHMKEYNLRIRGVNKNTTIDERTQAQICGGSKKQTYRWRYHG